MSDGAVALGAATPDLKFVPGGRAPVATAPGMEELPPNPEPRQGGETVAFRGGGFEPRPQTWIGWVVLAATLGVWHVASTTGWTSPLVLPSPAQVLSAFWTMVNEPDFGGHVRASLSRVLSGWLLGTALGLLVGCAMGIFSVARAAMLPVVSALYPVPMIAILPLLIVWLGIGESSKAAVILLGVFSPTVISTFSAVDNVPRGLIRMGQSFGLSWLAITAKIILPGALPGVLAGFRITAAISLILLVSAEMIGAEQGIGSLVLLAGNLMQTDKLVAGVLMLSATGLGIAWLLGRLERRLLRWR